MCSPQRKTRCIEESTVKFIKYLLCGEKFSVCLAGIAADCVAIFCCPLVVIQILVVIFVKLPSKLAVKTLDAIKCTKLNHNSISNMLKEEHESTSTFSSSDTSRKGSCSESDNFEPLLELKDEEFWKEYFDCHRLGFGEFKTIQASCDCRESSYAADSDTQKILK
ncbi:hypothetical protein O6H91_09G076300 [Diphasiastrum complanatum]|uniref:Uncharacterized protein n=1 Tax=Diphasiastrum complanatum TaxID=34168 RepID=A0ACC2CR22_DIPCM|nr:hypothetical protein O6H91_09G076300 [Diphasiastrum complanatum]